MAVLAAATVTFLNTYQGGRLFRAYKRRGNLVNVIYGNGTDTYPTSPPGIALPPFGAFGMVRFLEYLQIIDFNTGDVNVYKYDVTNKTIRIYVAGAEMTGASVPVNNSKVICMAIGW
jgi:hypothetical protein